MKKHIHILSPSGAIDGEYIDGAAARLQSWGYKVSISQHAKGRLGRFSGSVNERLSDLQRACDDNSIDIILCSRGGYGLAQYVDRIRLNPGQLIVGFSDITCLHSLAGHEGIASLHGIMCKHIATLSETAEPLTVLRKMLEGAPQDYTHTHKADKTAITGEASGVLRGGNLSIINGLRGTWLAIPDEGKGTILFLEDVGERPYHIDRMMHSLRIGGILKNLSGMIVGQFSECDEDELMEGTIYSRIRDMVKDYGYPVALGFPAGHVEHNIPLMLNTKISMKVSNTKTRIHYEV